MRYFEVPEIEFINHNGEKVLIKDTRPFEDIEVLKEVQSNNEKSLDLLAVRNDVYGSGKEDLSYRIFDINRVKILESRFNLNKIKTFEVG